jgi:nitrate/nitrite transport system permease protein
MSTLIKTCESFGLNWFVPFLRLAKRDNPNEQFRQILLNIGVPFLAVLVFLGAWSWTAANVEVSFGSLPGPTAVWVETKNLWADHVAERTKESDFYKRQAERKKAFVAENPTGEWKERRPTSTRSSRA